MEHPPADIWMGQVPSGRRSSLDGKGVKGDKDRSTESTSGKATRMSGGWGAEWVGPEVEKTRAGLVLCAEVGGLDPKGAGKLMRMGARETESDSFWKSLWHRGTPGPEDTSLEVHRPVQKRQSNLKRHGHGNQRK